MSKSFRDRLAALEALESAQQPEVPPYVCLHARDYAALDDVTAPLELHRAIAQAYGLCTRQKLYVGCCLCWGDDGETCRVCADQPVVGEVT